MRVLTWNLKHGRSVPGAGRDLLPEFAAALAQWDWDVALLQEVPPWWPEALAALTGAEFRLVLTSRNALLPVRRAIAVRWPELIKSSGGGSNAILSRLPISDHRMHRLRRFPERRFLHAVRLRDGAWIGNLHATAHNDPAALAEGRLAAAAISAWAAGAPIVLGGDFNLRSLSLEGFDHAGGHDVDHVFTVGLTAAGPAEVLDRGVLSDHAPVVVITQAARPSP
jgi:endonuclease/exonuclease/phosphatase family metal-dependent hydrolase